MRRFRSLFLALGLLAAACLNPKTDDLPAAGDSFENDDDSPTPGGSVGAAGTGNGPASNGGSASGPQNGGNGTGGAAGTGGGGGADFGIADAGVPDDAGSLADDSAQSQDGGDAGTQ